MEIIDGQIVYSKPKPEPTSSIVGGYLLVLALVAIVVGLCIFGYYSKKGHSQPIEITQSK